MIPDTDKSHALKAMQFWIAMRECVFYDILSCEGILPTLSKNEQKSEVTKRLGVHDKESL